MGRLEDEFSPPERRKKKINVAQVLAEDGIASDDDETDGDDEADGSDDDSDDGGDDDGDGE